MYVNTHSDPRGLDAAIRDQEKRRNGTGHGQGEKTIELKVGDN